MPYLSVSVGDRIGLILGTTKIQVEGGIRLRMVELEVLSKSDVRSHVQGLAPGEPLWAKFSERIFQSITTTLQEYQSAHQNTANSKVTKEQLMKIFRLMWTKAKILAAELEPLHRPGLSRHEQWYAEEQWFLDKKLQWLDDGTFQSEAEPILKTFMSVPLPGTNLFLHDCLQDISVYIFLISQHDDEYFQAKQDIQKEGWDPLLLFDEQAFRGSDPLENLLASTVTRSALQPLISLERKRHDFFADSYHKSRQSDPEFPYSRDEIFNRLVLNTAILYLDFTLYFARRNLVDKKFPRGFGDELAKAWPNFRNIYYRCVSLLIVADEVLKNLPPQDLAERSSEQSGQKKDAQSFEHVEDFPFPPEPALVRVDHV